GLHGCSCQ
ncbi:hypothetical protein D043_1685B, partial [Vibrio parahaemolyticus EKP-021]